MESTLTPNQVAAVLQTAANLRPDVRKAVVRIDPTYDRTLLLVDITFYTDGRRYQSETAYLKYLDGRSCGAILDDWIGPLPREAVATIARQTQTNAALCRERRNYLEHPIPVVLEMIRKHRTNPTPPPKRSKFKWDSPRPTAENPSGLLKTPIPKEPAEATNSPDNVGEPTGEPLTAFVTDESLLESGKFYRDAKDQVRPKLTRERMISLGMGKSARSEQYRIQRGKHPDDQE